MFHIPFLFRHPGRIPAASTCDLPVSNYDFLPTVLAYLGFADRLPEQPRSPGRDVSPALSGNPVPDWDPTVFQETETCRSIREERWKLVARHPAGPHELYDLRADPRERFNLFGQPGTEAEAARLSSRLDAFFATHADPRYDLWKGGRSKATRLDPVP
jgi:arylsulfatase A-like enzyme